VETKNRYLSRQTSSLLPSLSTVEYSEQNTVGPPVLLPLFPHLRFQHLPYTILVNTPGLTRRDYFHSLVHSSVCPFKLVYFPSKTALPNRPAGSILPIF